MTLESSLPYLSAVAALAGAATAGGAAPRAERAWKCAALGTLGLFAYLRGITPAAVALALILGAAGVAMAVRGSARWASTGAGLLAAGALSFAYLFIKSGGGVIVLLAQPWRVGALLAVLLLAGAGVASLRARVSGPRGGVGANVVALVVMTAASLTLPLSAWPAMAGAVLATAAEAALLGAAFGRWPPEGPQVQRLAWTGGYLGQAAMAYAFLR